MFEKLEKYPKTFTKFKEWLYLKLNKNVKNFKMFGRYPDNMKVPYVLEFLESLNINVLEILCYYNYESSNQAKDFNQLLLYSIYREFNNLENNIKLNYDVF